MWADVDTSESLLIIIYLTFFSIQLPQNKGELCCSIFFFNSQQQHHRYRRIMLTIVTSCLSVFKVRRNATIRKPDYAHTN